MKKFGSILLLAIVALAGIATCASAFNTLEPFYIVCGLITLVSEGYFIVKTGKKLNNK